MPEATLVYPPSSEPSAFPDVVPLQPWHRKRRMILAWAGFPCGSRNTRPRRLPTPRMRKTVENQCVVSSWFGGAGAGGDRDQPTQPVQTIRSPHNPTSGPHPGWPAGRTLWEGDMLLSPPYPAGPGSLSTPRTLRRPGVPRAAPCFAPSVWPHKRQRRPGRSDALPKHRAGRSSRHRCYMSMRSARRIPPL